VGLHPVRWSGCELRWRLKPAAAPVPPAEVCSDSDNDGVCDNVDKCPDTPANVTVDADGCPAVAEVVRVELDVKFDFDKSVVKPNSYGDIKNLADFMKQYPPPPLLLKVTLTPSVLTLTTRSCPSVVQTPLSKF
jgi:OOP family OmpA-OmpF porin